MLSSLQITNPKCHSKASVLTACPKISHQSKKGGGRKSPSCSITSDCWRASANLVESCGGCRMGSRIHHLFPAARPHEGFNTIPALTGQAWRETDQSLYHTEECIANPPPPIFTTMVSIDDRADRAFWKCNDKWRTYLRNANVVWQTQTDNKSLKRTLSPS